MLSPQQIQTKKIINVDYIHGISSSQHAIRKRPYEPRLLEYVTGWENLSHAVCKNFTITQSIL